MPSDAPTPRRPWYADGLSFACTQCGNCCTGPSGYVWFTPDEGQRIADRLGIEEREFRRRYAKRRFGKWTLGEIKRDTDVYDCVFLKHTESGQRVCSIYDVRPTQCRTWPFWEENLASPEAWDQAAVGCPGMRRTDGKHYSFDRIQLTVEGKADAAGNPLPPHPT
jgi:Fe-S-cluster containining protein